MTEAEFQAQVIDIAQFRGWKVMHQRPAMGRNGRWITAITGDAGFPDLVLARAVPGDLIFAELKKEGGRVSALQAAWIRTLAATGADSVEDFYADVPDDLRLHRPLDLPPALVAEDVVPVDR